MNDNADKPGEANRPPEDTDEIAELAEALEAGVEHGEGDVPNDDAAAEDPLEQLAAENAELNDKMLRLAADMENLRRRTEREKAEATLYAASNFARDMLGVSDNMDRALGAVSQEQRDAADEVTKTLLQGIEMVQRELLNTFGRHGIRRIEPLDEKFDPNLHQAMFEVPDASKPAGTVVQIVQPGFVIGERVLRPAMVGVAKGGAKPAPDAPETPQAGAEAQ